MILRMVQSSTEIINHREISNKITCRFSFIKINAFFLFCKVEVNKIKNKNKKLNDQEYVK